MTWKPAWVRTDSAAASFDLVEILYRAAGQISEPGQQLLHARGVVATDGPRVEVELLAVVARLGPDLDGLVEAVHEVAKLLAQEGETVAVKAPLCQIEEGAAGLATAANVYSGTREGIYPRSRAEASREIERLRSEAPDGSRLTSMTVREMAVRTRVAPRSPAKP